MKKPAPQTQQQHAAAVCIHRKVASLEEQCARLKQQKRVAEKFATDAQAQTAVMEAKLRDAVRKAAHYEQLAEIRLGEVHHLRRAEQVSFQARVEQDVFRAVEASGDPQLFPYDLTPTLAAVQSKVGGAALQRRAARLEDPCSHPLGLHPGVHEWGSNLGPLVPEDLLCCPL